MEGIAGIFDNIIFLFCNWTGNIINLIKNREEAK